MDVKRCSKCGETKPIEMFSQIRSSVYCKLCQLYCNGPISKTLAKAIARAQKAQEKKQRDPHKKRGIYDTHRKFNKEYREATLVALKANAEKRRQAKYIFNSSKQTAYQRRYARLKANGGSHTKAEIQALLEAQNHCCAYCKRCVKLTEDHIIPVARAAAIIFLIFVWPAGAVIIKNALVPPPNGSNAGISQNSPIQMPHECKEAARFSTSQ